MRRGHPQSTLIFRDVNDTLSHDSDSDRESREWVEFFQQNRQPQNINTEGDLDKLLVNYPQYAAFIRIFADDSEEDELSRDSQVHRFFQALDMKPEDLPVALQNLLNR